MAVSTSIKGDAEMESVDKRAKKLAKGLIKQLAKYAKEIPVCEGCPTGHIIDMKVAYPEGTRPFDENGPKIEYYPCQSCDVIAERLHAVCLFEIQDAVEGGVCGTKRDTRKWYDHLE
jgi:hypothetical protein